MKDFVKLIIENLAKEVKIADLTFRPELTATRLNVTIAYEGGKEDNAAHRAILKLFKKSAVVLLISPRTQPSMLVCTIFCKSVRILV